MKILGIDPGYERLGIAIIEKAPEKNNNKETLLFSECFKTHKDTPFVDRLAEIGNEIESVIKKHKPEYLAIENLFFNTNQKTAMRVAEVRGTLLYIAKKAGLEIYEYTPLQIKSAVAGNGRGSKKDVINMLHKLISVDKKIQHDDEYDAIAVAITCFACNPQLMHS